MDLNETAARREFNAAMVDCVRSRRQRVWSAGRERVEVSEVSLYLTRIGSKCTASVHPWDGRTVRLEITREHDVLGELKITTRYKLVPHELILSSAEGFWDDAKKLLGEV